MTTTFYSANSIKLASNASSLGGAYVGYDIIFTRLDKVTGRKTVQRMGITAYDGSTKVATIDGVWLDNVYPGAETATTKDTYEIVHKYGDSRVSINPAMQALDYITSDRYGRGLNPYTDLYLPSWQETGRRCDARSDVTVLTTSGTIPSPGAVYRYPASGTLLFQGTVVSTSGRYVRFTDVLGKLTNKWNSWKDYPLNAIVYNGSNTYLVDTAGTKPTEPVHTSGATGGMTFISTFNLTKVSGTGGATLAVPGGGNPIKSLVNGVPASGYSLYDADGIDYWRYAGWDEHDQRYATLHQTNLTIDTGQPMFDNMNSLLEHFGGILRYNNGRYFLELEEAETGIQANDDPRHITTNDISTRIRISDEGIRNSFNSLTVAFADPANKFEARNISFFNSDYLKIDRNVSRKGTLSIPGITSYYNARLLADKYLTKSRYNLTVSFNMVPKGALLLAGRVIEIPYERYGWTNKKFRITDMTHNTDCSVDIVAEEYDDSLYDIKPITKLPGMGLGGSYHITTLDNPTNLIATSDTNNNEGVAGVELTWDNAPSAEPGSTSTEIHMSYSPNFEITATDITSNTFTTATPHGLKLDSLVTFTGTLDTNGLIGGAKYYVADVPSSTTFKLSLTKGGAFATFTNGTGAFKFGTTVILAAVPVPENSYFDAYTGGDVNRVEKYYWIRHRINVYTYA